MENKYAGMSPYNYSMNNPVMLNDPSGADPYQNGTAGVSSATTATSGGTAEGGWSKAENGAYNVWGNGSGGESNQGDNNGVYKEPTKSSDYGEGYSDDKTGTDIFTTKGDFIGHLNTKDKFQIHFVDPDFGGAPFFNPLGKVTAEKIMGMNMMSSVSERKNFSDLLRSNSIAFIGENSISQLEKISLISANKSKYGTEVGFVALISSSREVLFSKINYDGDASDDSYPMGEGVKYYSDNGGDLNTLLGIGHSHTTYWNYNPSEQYGPQKNRSVLESHSIYSDPTEPKIKGGSIIMIDYKDYLGRKTPLFISSMVGLTIYTPQSKDQYSNAHFKTPPDRRYLYNNFK